MVAVIAIHCGAGSFKKKSHANYKKLSRIACRRGIALLKQGKSCLEVIKAVIAILENDPLTNAGYGSNLTNTGNVETDASIMDGDTLTFGACGAVKNVKNPIQLAYKIHKNQNTPSPYGLIPPSLLVGKGALEFARKSNVKIVKNENLISPRALKQFKKFKTLTDPIDNRLDTVGAVCIDLNGQVASGCSSGGILLKNPGRVGQAAIYGSGVWAENYAPDYNSSVAVCTSGCGEYLVRTQLAKVVSDDLKDTSSPTETFSQTINEKFLKSKYLKNVGQKLCGALVLHSNKQTGDVSVLWGHSSEAMCVGYMTSDNEKPTALISELPVEIMVGEQCIVSGMYVFNDKNKSD